MNYAKRKGLEKTNLYDEKDEQTYSMIKEEKDDYYKKFFGHIKREQTLLSFYKYLNYILLNLFHFIVV